MKLPTCTPAALLALALSIAPWAAQAQTSVTATAAASTPAAKYTAESKALSTRYQSDLKICNSDTDAGARMPCKRDARAQYDQGLQDAAARRDAAIATAKAAPVTAAASATPKAAPVCAECGTVAAVNKEQREGKPSAVGAIAGGVVGGLLGNQIGHGTGKDLATVAGAAGGVYAGREVEKRVNTKTVWVVKVNFGDGSSGSYEFANDPGYKTGDAVKKAGNSISR